MTVFLVGAGPGDPGLMTVRGLQVLREAEVVLYDRLVAAELLEEAPEGAELVYVGKQPRGPGMSQVDIDALLVEHGRSGRRVVRLKGGDPYVFGQGGDEAIALAAAGIPFEVVSGVSAAVAVPAAAGIPLSHRDHAANIVIVAAHRAGAQDVPYAHLAGMDTLVFLMGAARVRAICEGLVAAGRAPDTPAAAIYRGTTPQQRELFSNLAELPDVFEREGFGPPSVIVVGDVVALAARIGPGMIRGSER